MLGVEGAEVLGAEWAEVVVPLLKIDENAHSSSTGSHLIIMQESAKS